MLLKSEDIQINEESPFLNCQLDRQPIADNLTKLILTLNQPFVLCISSPWGTGKTTFIKMWMQKLKIKNNIPCIYFNAWQNDFSNDPFVSFVGEINSFIKANFTDNQEINKRYEKVISNAARFFKKVSPLALKVASRGAVKGLDDLSELLNFDNEDENAIADFLSNLLKAEIEDYNLKKKSIDGFKTSLGAFIDALDKSENYQKPLVILIDEIDRCRPTYALELLEKIKHLFDLKNMVFVLAVDKDQLHTSIKTMYGNDMDSDGYMRRFIDLDYSLPKPTYPIYTHHLFKTFELDKTQFIQNNNGPAVSLAISYFSELYNFSLRKQNQVFTRLKCILTYAVNTHATLLIFAICLRFHDEKLYQRLFAKDIEKQRLFAKLYNRQIIDNSSYKQLQNSLLFIEVALNAYLGTESEYSNYIKSSTHLARLTTQSSVEKAKLIKKYSDDYTYSDFNNRLIPEVIETIEFSWAFS